MIRNGRVCRRLPRTLATPAKTALGGVGLREHHPTRHDTGAPGVAATARRKHARVRHRHRRAARSVCRRFSSWNARLKRGRTASRRGLRHAAAHPVDLEDFIVGTSPSVLTTRSTPLRDFLRDAQTRSSLQRYRRRLQTLYWGDAIAHRRHQLATMVEACPPAPSWWSRSPFATKDARKGSPSPPPPFGYAALDRDAAAGSAATLAAASCRPRRLRRLRRPIESARRASAPPRSPPAHREGPSPSFPPPTSPPARRRFRAHFRPATPITATVFSHATIDRLP